MAEHSMAEARDRFPELIDRALGGESVVITRDGRPVVELRAVAVAARPMTSDDVDWLRRRRAPLLRPATRDAAGLISDLRDEGER